MARNFSLSGGSTVEKNVWWLHLLPSVEICRIEGSKEDGVPTETWISIEWLVFYVRLTIEKEWQCR